MIVLGAQPGRKIITYFLMAIFLGALLLLLPISSTGEPISWVNALFTATSAVCVTGLTVVDTAAGFSIFGQIVILILIQLGGLGIMTFATMLIMMAGARVPLLDRLDLSQSLAVPGRARSSSLLVAVIITTFICESIGALVLFADFSRYYPPGQAFFHSIFHAVSAFCNAGFSTVPGGLENFRTDLSVIATFSFLIILGGLGFVVIQELLERIRHKKTRLSLHSKICLSATGVLLLTGTIVFFLLEHHNTLIALSPVEALANSFFQSVTARTAGFNTIPQTALTEVSLLATMLLMFIGACPGSTGGGIKTSTAAVILFLIYSRFMGRRSVSAFRRSINVDSIIRALTVVLLASLIIVIVLALLMTIGEIPVAHKLSHGWFEDNLFEVISAFSTVGLSLGMTGHVDNWGKLVLILTMFIGRVGLLTLAFSLARPTSRGEIVYAEESVMIG